MVLIPSEIKNFLNLVPKINLSNKPNLSSNKDTSEYPLEMIKYKNCPSATSINKHLLLHFNLSEKKKKKTD